jgi:RND family efflux transporter MFP subunit
LLSLCSLCSLWLIVFLVAGCNSSTDRSSQGKGSDAPAAKQAVKTARPVRQAMSHRIEQPGEIRASLQTPIHVRISGFVAKVYKDIGDPVKEGELLAELSVPEMDEELNLKQAEVAVAEAKIKQAKKLLGAAEADLKSAGAKLKEAEASRVRVTAELKRAESTLARFQKSASVLTGENIDEARLGVEASKAAVTEVEAKVGSASAARDSAEARRDKAETDINLAEAQHKAAQADERRLAALLKYAKLPAPFAGVVTWRNVDPGWLLQPSTGAKGEAVFVVASLDPVRVFVDVPERDAVLVKDGTPAIVRVQALRGETFPGAVTRTAWSLDSKDRTLRTEIDLKNPEGKLRPGMYVTSVITVERGNVWTVPASAVLTQGDQTYCYVVEGGKAVRTPVQVGFRNAQSVEVAQKRTPGPQGEWRDFTGEEVVVVNAAAVSDGQAVPASAAP